MIGLYNNYHKKVMDGTLDLDNAAVVIKVLLLRDTSTYTFNPDHDTVNDILVTNGGVEISVASYTRQTVSGKTVSVDDTNNRGIFDCNNVAFGTLESGQTVEAVVFYLEVNDDTDSIPLIYIDGKANVTASAPAFKFSSLTSLYSTSGSITGATNANPCVITSANHGLANGDKVYISSVGGMTELNGNVYTVANVDTNTFELSGVNSSGYGAYTSGGTWQEVMRVYVDPLKYAIPAGSSVDFGGGATGTTTGAAAKDQRYVDVINLGAAVTEGDVSSDVATTINLPATLGNGEFNVNAGSSGLVFSRNR